jgi:sialate O-acetylesterase
VAFTRAPQDWQLLSANAQGVTTMPLAGTWRRPASAGLLGRNGCQVEVRLCHVDTGLPVAAHLQWALADTRTDGTWDHILLDIPAGGPYRLETRLNPKGNKTREWAWRGDQRHWLAVGDAYVIAGQSNASGYGAPPYADAPEIGVHLFGQDSAWKLASHPLHDGTRSRYLPALQPYVPGHSPYLRFAKRLRAATGRPIALIPAALGGSFLSEWQAEGALYANMLAMVGDAGVTPRGVLFAQGESDAKGDSSLDYGDRFAASIALWRHGLSRFGCPPDLPVIAAQLGRYYSKNPGEDDPAWSAVREAQRKVAMRMDKVGLLPTLDAPLCDSIHLSAAGNLMLGDRYADAALGLVYEKTGEWRAPNIRSARLTDVRRVELEFDNVADRIDTQDPAAKPFKAYDAAGEVGVDRIVYPMDHRIELNLARLPEGILRVSAGYGENPPPLPCDVERRLPILAFDGVEVRSP